MKRRVVVLSSMFPDDTRPDYGTFVWGQVHAVSRLGWEVDAIAPVPWAPAVLGFRPRWQAYHRAKTRERRDGVDVWRPRIVLFPRSPRKWVAWSMYATVKYRARELLRSRALLHAHRILPEGWVAIKLKQLSGLPVVVTGHGGDVYGLRNESEREAARWVLRHADAAIAVSEYIANRMYDLGSEHIEVIPNGYDEEQFANARSAPGNGRSLCYVGRVDRRKGVFDLLEAFARVRNSVRGATLTFVGGGPALKELRRRVEHLGLKEYVAILGPLPHDRVPAFLASQDVFILPSYAEGLPTALVEAMAAGLAVIASPAGGITELIRHEHNGLIVEASDITGLERCITRVVNDGHLQRKLRQAARRTVRSLYSWSASARQLVAVYDSLINRARNVRHTWNEV